MADRLVPPGHELIEVRVSELKRLFNGIDPSPFRDKDLDPNAEEFIVGWAREVRRDAPLALQIHIDAAPGADEDSALVEDAVHEYFRQRGLATRQRLRQVLRVGRTSLAIGIVFLAASLGLGGMAERMIGAERIGALVRESFLIGGWVAMWRPIETFLYDWWPIRAEARLFDRLAKMPIRIVHGQKPAAG